MTVLKLCKTHTMLLGWIFKTFTHNLNELRIFVRDQLALNGRATRFGYIRKSIPQSIRK